MRGRRGAVPGIPSVCVKRLSVIFSVWLFFLFGYFFCLVVISVWLFGAAKEPLETDVMAVDVVWFLCARYLFVGSFVY